MGLEEATVPPPCERLPHMDNVSCSLLRPGSDELNNQWVRRIEQKGLNQPCSPDKNPQDSYNYTEVDFALSISLFQAGWGMICEQK